eukprot:CAMPEP_0177248194 /NCGR_PEP_ID=MMETSP0367-20130122/52028_1 /TAXON_ID=447022 ORGANISM="Scrippsiella hangoei-like, Strain SHHI-4" /NCGR_SAMPLE_ID=MMETSP0367 /ASSEMBLY_ACC=CAM_ASM_000362 /LENGTH=135 /DNA_ID=CAMNT_0018700495 /DNA_START=163 /DNA_END=570 /DNA_ORIENTATION=-
MPVLLAVGITTLVLPPVRVQEDAVAMHRLPHPCALERAVVAPDVASVAVDGVLVELAHIVRSVGPKVLAMTVLAPGSILADVPRPVRPLLVTLSGLRVLHPLPNVLRTVLMYVGARPMLHVLRPLTVICSAVSML